MRDRTAGASEESKIICRRQVRARIVKNVGWCDASRPCGGDVGVTLPVPVKNQSPTRGTRPGTRSAGNQCQAAWRKRAGGGGGGGDATAQGNKCRPVKRVGQVDIVCGTYFNIARGGRNARKWGCNSPQDIDIATGGQQDIAAGIGDGDSAGRRYQRIHVDVPPTTHHQVAVGGGDRRVNVHVSGGVQGQRRRTLRARGSVPHDRRTYSDITKSASARAGIRRSDRDVGAQWSDAAEDGRDVGYSYVGRVRAASR